MIVKTSGHYARNGFLTSRGLREVAQRSRSEYSLDGMAEKLHLDKVGSVSALAEAEALHVFDDDVIDQQYRRFLNGS